MNDTFHDCVELTRVLDGDADPQHLATCATCSDLTEELEGLQDHAANLSPLGWAGQPAPHLDVEAALAVVLAGGRPKRRRGSRRAATTLRVLCSAAALLLVFSIGAPVVLRQRIEHTSRQSLPSASGDDQLAVFWTSQGSEHSR